MRYFLMFFWALVLGNAGSNCPAQVFSNDAAQREKHFIYEVKQLDEFLERFNDDRNSFIRQVYESYKVKYNVKREDLIRSLFNYESETWDSILLNSFVDAVLSKKQLLSFYSNQWYAEAVCVFKDGEREMEIPVFLRVDADEENRSQWLIEGIKKYHSRAPAPTSAVPARTSKAKFIHPASHSNNFVVLSTVFDDKENLSNYFSHEAFKSDMLNAFYTDIKGGRLKLQYVKRVKYYFLQIDGWMFTVERFQRKGLNSGWLISHLQKISTSEKQNFHQYLSLQNQ